MRIFPWFDLRCSLYSLTPPRTNTARLPHTGAGPKSHCQFSFHRKTLMQGVEGGPYRETLRKPIHASPKTNTTIVAFFGEKNEYTVPQRDTRVRSHSGTLSFYQA